MSRVEIRLRKICVEENGELRRGPSASIFYAELLYPRVNVKSVEAMHVMKLDDGAEIDFDSATSSATGKPFTYADKVLFKQSVDGRAELRVSVVTTHQASKLDHLLAELFGVVFKAAWGLALGGISGDLLRRAGDRAAKFHLESISADDASWVVGAARLEMDEEALPGVVSLPLEVPQNIDVSQFELTYGRPRRTTTRLARRGEINGYVELEIARI